MSIFSYYNIACLLQMTYYPGGKKRNGKYIAEIMYEYKNATNSKINGYCEPFCGMLGVFRHSVDLFGQDIKYWANDDSEPIISMWTASQNGWTPKDYYTKQEYDTLKVSESMSPDKCFLGYASSLRSVFFGSYNEKAKIDTQARNVKLIADTVQRTKFTLGNYTACSGLCNYLIYCDPPYADTKHSYYSKGKFSNSKFDHCAFWKWCKSESEKNTVFVSERCGPIIPYANTKIRCRGQPMRDEYLYLVE